MQYSILIALFLSFISQTFAGEADPFKAVTLHTLSNGMKVVLAPGDKAKLTKIKVDVGVGFTHEKEGTYGVSHLLEHVLFRDNTLENDMSYLQLIEEEEGSANGTTSWDRTSYFGKIDSSKAEWLFRIFYKMLSNPSMTKEHVESEKKTVFLEIGEPDPFVRFFGFGMSSIFSLDYLKEKDYWESEFGVNFDSNFTRAQEQHSTIHLTQEQVVAHFNKYYDPSNMTLTVAGKFNKKQILALIDETFATMKSKDIGDQRPQYDVTPSKKPYFYSSIYKDVPTISLGYKVWDMSQKEKHILSSYTGYLSHRLMKKLRNANGDTYTVRSYNSLEKGYGYFGIEFESSREKYKENFNTVNQIMRNELQQGKLSDEDVKEGIRLYLNNFNLIGNDADGLYYLSRYLYQDFRVFKNWFSPQTVLEKVTPQEYKSVLKKLALASRRQIVKDEPELFFRIDYMVFYAMSIMFFLSFFRRTLTKSFEHAKVRWVRSVKYIPLKVLEVGIVMIGILVAVHFEYLFEFTLYRTVWFKSLGIAGHYIENIVGLFVVIAGCQLSISILAKKLYVMDDKLVIKSLSYYSSHIPLSEIKCVEAKSCFSFKLNTKTLKMFFLRNYFYHFSIWKKGIFIELKNDDCIFIGVKDAEAAASELNQFINEEVVSELKIAA